MRVLQIHNQYFSGLGGEDTVVRLEKEMLVAHGHDVQQLIVSTSELRGATPLRLLEAAAASVWSRDSYQSVARQVRSLRPDVVHVHNTFPLLSASVYYAARRNGACIVQTLHNYRFACANGYLLRAGNACEDCVGHAKWRGVMHRCYAGSLGISASVVALQTAHRVAGTLRREVDAYITLTSFQREIVIRDGLPAARIFVKPNFLPGSGPLRMSANRKKQIVFIGFLRPEKGIDLLLEAWAAVRPEGYQLVLLGEGPERPALEQRFANDPSLLWMGFQAPSTVARLLAESRYLVIASRWYEGFPMALLEAFSAGTPAIAPGHGAFPQLLREGACGLLFTPSLVDSLAAALRRATAMGDEAWREQSDAARMQAAGYGVEANYQRLMEVYAAAQVHYRATRPAQAARDDAAGRVALQAGVDARP